MDTELQKAPYNVMKDEFLFSEDLNLKGDDIQKLSVIQALPQLLQAEPQQTFTRLIPKILQELPNSSCEFHVMTSKVFKVLMERNVPANLLHAVLQGIESRDPIVANAWMDTLLSIIGVLTELQLKNEILPLVNSKAMLSQPITSRIASCRILGRLALHKALDPTDVKRDVLPLAQSLCQDCHPDVRTAMCLQLPHIAQGLGSNLLKGNLLSSLVELAADENMYVRSASVTAVVQMLPHVTLEIKKATILPLVKQLCEKSMRTDDITATTMAREFGRIVEGLQATLQMTDCIWFLEEYKIFAHRGLSFNIDEFRSADASLDVTCRQQCAANLPAVGYFTFATVPNQTDFLYTIFQDLAADPCYLVRRTVAGCLHELVKIFGPQNRLLKSDFVRLLRDDSEDVLQMLVPHMGNTLELFCAYGTLSRQATNQSVMEIGRAMLKCQYELTSGYNWRLLTHFIHQLEHLPNCMPPDFIHQHFTPVVLNLAVQGRHKPVRSQAARTLLVFLRYNSKETQRKWLRENMISQLCRAKSCYTRHIFIRLCVNAIDIFSEKYFKEYFYDNLLDLAEDPIANIRLSVADLFVVLKEMIVLPDDKLLSARLSEIFKKFTSEEKDRDVMEIFKRKMSEINNPGRVVNKDKDERQKEERRRQDEEERIAAGGKTLLFTNNNKKAMAKTFSRPNSITKPSPSSSLDLATTASTKSTTSSASSRSSSVPPKSGTSPNQTNDMSFLEQHFYIDAGVNLPTKPSVGKLTNSFSTVQVQDSEIALSETWSTNYTDDDKVNLRKLSKNKTERKIKRYSSVLSATCLEQNHERKALNRRSLNITTKESSRIPICSKNSPKKSRSTSTIKEIMPYNENNDDNSSIEMNKHKTEANKKKMEVNRNKSDGRGKIEVNKNKIEATRNEIEVKNKTEDSRSKIEVNKYKIEATRNEIEVNTNEIEVNKNESGANNNKIDFKVFIPNGAISKVKDNLNVSNSKDHLLQLGNNNGDQSSPKAQSLLPVLKRRSQSEVRK